MWPWARRSHCSAAHGALGHKCLRPLAHFVGRHHFAGAEHVDTVEVGDGALIGDGERGQPVDVVAPHVDADRRVHRRGEDVDDRAAHGNLAPVLHLVLAAVPDVDEALDELVAIDRRTAFKPHRLDVFDVRAETLNKCADRRDDNARRLRRLLQPPHRAEAAAHRLDVRADALERQRLPRGEHVNGVGTKKGAQVVGDVLCVGRGWRRHQDRVTLRQ